MTLKYLIKILKDLDPNSEVNHFDIIIDNVHLSIKDVVKTEEYVGTETKSFKRSDLLSEERRRP